MQKFEQLFLKHMKKVCDEYPDPSHDILHVQRVVHWAKKLAKDESANLDIVIPAAYLHDCIYISKADLRRSQASKISADLALKLLKNWNYPEEHFEGIHHAIHAHSFSANITPTTIEAKVVQDADRLDAIGSIGIMRCFSFGGLAKRDLYNVEDPFCKNRTPHDKTNSVDHFYGKLLNLPKSLNTKSAQKEGQKRLHFMQNFLQELQEEIIDL